MYLRSLLDIIVRRMAAAALAALTVAACSEPASAPLSPSFATGPNALERTYRLGIGDKLKITVFGEENLSGPTEVNAMGQIALPLAGEIPAKGLAIGQLRDAVAAGRAMAAAAPVPEVPADLDPLNDSLPHSRGAGEGRGEGGGVLR